MHRIRRKGICWRLWLWRRARARRRWQMLTPAEREQKLERLMADANVLLARHEAREAKRNEPLAFAVKKRRAARMLVLAWVSLFAGILAVVGGPVWLVPVARSRQDWPDLLQPLTLAFVGVVVTAAAWLGIPRCRYRCAQMRQFPDEPWRHYPQWQHGRLPAFRALPTACAMLLVGIALLAPAVALAAVGGYRDWSQATPLVVLILAAFSLLPLIAAWESFIYWRRYGQPELEFITRPGVIGHGLLATLTVRGSFVADQVLTLRLVCQDVSDSSHYRDRELWTGEYTATRMDMRVHNGLTIVPVAFRIPPDVLPVYEKKRSGDRVAWRLTIRGDAKSQYFFGIFEVPVFKATPDQTCAILAAARERLRLLPGLAKHATERGVNV